jgi:hypothetical protein
LKDLFLAIEYDKHIKEKEISQKDEEQIGFGCTLENNLVFINLKLTELSQRLISNQIDLLCFIRFDISQIILFQLKFELMVIFY